MRAVFYSLAFWLVILLPFLQSSEVIFATSAPTPKLTSLSTLFPLLYIPDAAQHTSKSTPFTFAFEPLTQDKEKPPATEPPDKKNATTPVQSTVTVLTKPTGLQMMINSETVTSPSITDTPTQSFVRIEAINPQLHLGKTYLFRSWNDGNTDETRIIQADQQGTTLIAVFEETSASYYKAEYFENVRLEGKPVYTELIPEISFQWQSYPPLQSLTTKPFSARFSKQEQLKPGRYRFAVTSNSRYRLSLGKNTVFDFWDVSPQTTEAVELTLLDSLTTIELQYKTDHSNESLSLTYERIGNADDNTWEAQYFQNSDLSGEPALTTTIHAVDFSWGKGSPGPGIPDDNFSGRFEKSFQTETDSFYHFDVLADDGIRIYLDNEIILDRWQDNTELSTFQTYLKSGKHTLAVEYYERTDNARLRVTYHPVAIQDRELEQFTGEYFSNKSLSGLPSIIRQDQTLQFDWGKESPDPGIPADSFSARWTKKEHFLNGTYAFSLQADDGVRLKINDIVYVDTWTKPSLERKTVHVPIRAGQHTIVIEYFEDKGDAQIELRYTKIADLPSETISAVFYNTKEITGPVAYETTYPSLSFDWGGKSPDIRVNNDNFSARMKKTEVFSGGQYRFSVKADDGIRIYLDDQRILDRWEDQPLTMFTFFVDIPPGVHTITIEYYDSVNTAILSVDWRKVSTPLSTYTAEYFDNRSLSGVPRLIRQDEAIQFNWGTDSPAPGLSSNEFSVRWKKKEYIESGTYRFFIKADDGIRLFIDDVLLVNLWNNNSENFRTIDIPLSFGEKTIQIEYYNNGGAALAEFHWERL